MNIEQVRDFTLSLHGVTEDQPFGDDNITFRVEGKIFLCLWLGDGNCATATTPSLPLSIGTRNTGVTSIMSSSTPTSSQR